MQLGKTGNVQKVPTNERIDEAEDERDQSPVDIVSAPSKNKIKTDEQGQEDDINHKILKIDPQTYQRVTEESTLTNIVVQNKQAPAKTP